MEFSRIIAIAVVVVSCFGVLTHQKPQAVETPSAPVPLNTNVTERVEDNAGTEAVAKNCTTSKGLKGTCVQRQTCDYSTSAIDLTLYAPHGYKKFCTIEEVCCPFDSLVRVDSMNQQNLEEDNFNFDDDV